MAKIIFSAHAIKFANLCETLEATGRVADGFDESKRHMVNALRDSSKASLDKMIGAAVKAGNNALGALCSEASAYIDEQREARIEKIRARKSLEKDREIMAFFDAAAEAVSTMVAA